MTSILLDSDSEPNSDSDFFPPDGSSEQEQERQRKRRKRFQDKFRSLPRSQKLGLMLLILGVLYTYVFRGPWWLCPKIVLILRRACRTLFVALWISMDYKLVFQSVAEEAETTGLHPVEQLRARGDGGRIHKRNADRLYRLFTRNGGLFIKAGQFIASLNQVLPRTYVNTMRRCQDSVPFTMSFNQVRRLVRKEFGKEVHELFESFEEEPFAAASVGQVYRATIRRKVEGSDQDEIVLVAVKVQYPGIEREVKADMKILSCTCSLLEWLFPQLRMRWLLTQITKHLPNEMDFLTEAENCERCGDIITDSGLNQVARVPWIDHERTSKRVLTMEYIDGAKVNHLGQLEERNVSPRWVSDALVRFYSELCFRIGVVHADPHPGNILVTNVDGPQLVILDHNPYVEMTEFERIEYCRLWKAAVDMDKDGLRRAARAFGVEEHFKLMSSMFTSRRWEEIENSVLREKVVDKAKAEQYLYDHFFEGTHLLSKINKRMLLMLKSIDLVRSIKYDLGLLDVGFVEFALAAQRNLNVHEVRRETSSVLKGLKWVGGHLAILRLVIRLYFYWYFYRL